MKSTVKPLHLILYSTDEGDHKFLVEDGIFFDPNYKIGDIIEILSTNKHDAETGVIIPYKIVQVQKIIAVDKTASLESEYKLYVKVRKLQEGESQDLSNSSFIIKGNQATV